MFMFVICFSWTSLASTLNVDLDVRTRVPESDQASKQKNIAIFVLDRSGSMNYDAIGSAARTSQSRNDQLVASVKERIKTLSETEPSTEVYLLPFSGSIGKMEKFSLDSESDKKALFAWEGFNKDKCVGITYLYDTLAYALDCADGFIQSDPKVKVQVFGYTDGNNFTAGNDKVKNENIGKTVIVQYSTNKENDSKEIDEAYKNFFRRYGEKIKKYIVAGKMDDIQWRWLGEGEPPKGVGNIRKDEYRMIFKSNSSALKNPASVSEQSLPATLVIPIPSEYEKDLSNLNAKLIFEVNGKKISDADISLAGSNKISLNIPDKTSVGQFKGKIYIDSIPDKWDRILLKPPAPIEVEFSASQESALMIVSPASGSTIQLGSGVKNTELIAKVKGTDIKKVKWTVENSKTGKKSEIFKDPTPVNNGEAKCVFPGDASIGGGVTLFIQAEAVEASEPVVSPQIELRTELDDKLDINVKVVGGSEYLRDVPFGSQVELEADCGGCIDKKNIEWFAEFDGKERSIGKGGSCKTQKEEPNGKNIRTVYYIARAKLPDGSLKEAITWVNYYCGCLELEASLKLQEKDGITKTSFGLNNDPVNTEIVCYKQGVPVHVELREAVIDMGNGTNYNSKVVNNHCYHQYGTYEIKANAKCKDCGSPYNISPVQIKVEKQQPKASFEVEEKGTYYSVLGKIHLHSTSTGDIENYIWTVDGKELTEYSGKPNAVIELPSTPCEIEVKLKVTGPQGADPSESETKSLRIRFGWWLIIILLLAGFLIWWFVFYKPLIDNGPAGWKIAAWGRQEPERTEKGIARECREMVNRGSGMTIRKFWSLADKKATIPVDKLGLDSTTLAQFAATDVVSIMENNRRPSLNGFASGSSVDYHLNTGDHNKRFYLFKPAPSAAGKREPRYVRVVLDFSERSHVYQFLLVILSLAMLAGIAWLTIIFAI